MRIITVRQPWADAIIWGEKNIENRPRNIAGTYRGPVLIHAGLHRTTPGEINDYLARFPEAEELIWERAPQHAAMFGVILGVADLTGVHLVKGATRGGSVCFDDHTIPGHVCSPWAQEHDEFPAGEGYHLTLANARALDHPIPFKGGLGLRHAPFEIAGDTLYRQTGECSCPAGAALGDRIGHATGCGLVVAATLFGRELPTLRVPD